MSATFRQIVNNVLQNIGTTMIPTANTTITDTYQLQVANFVNHIKESCEDENNWRPLWQTFNITYLLNNTTQQIIDAANPLKMPNSRSKLIRMMNRRFGREVGLCFDTTTFGIPFIMGEMPIADTIYFNTVLNQTPVAYSTNYSVQDAGNDVVNLITYPGSNATRNLQITMCVPQQRIDPTVAGSAIYPWLGTVGLDTPILIPSMPIELGSSWYALSERGEELGTGGMFTEDRFRSALDDACSRDIGEAGGLEMIIA